MHVHQKYIQLKEFTDAVGKRIVQDREKTSKGQMYEAWLPSHRYLPNL